jgi:ABC-type antimicrobial peptide transport system permease subunit
MGDTSPPSDSQSSTPPNPLTAGHFESELAILTWRLNSARCWPEPWCATEFAIRLSVGATRGLLVRQLLTEHLLLGACALLLAVTGLGGMVAFSVSHRRREIGVRQALGARPASVLRAVIGQFAVPLLAGVAAGSALAAAAGTALAGELYGVSGLDPVAHLGAFVLFGAVTALAAAPSLRRAVRVDPVETLRHE